MKLFSFPAVFEDIYESSSYDFKKPIKEVLDTSKSIFNKVRNKLTKILDFNIGDLDLSLYNPEGEYDIKFEKSPKFLKDYFRYSAKSESLYDLERAINYAKNTNITTQHLRSIYFKDKVFERENPSLARKSRWIGLEYNLEKDLNRELLRNNFLNK